MGEYVLTPPALARTYSPSGFDDGWELVDQYLLVVEWAELNPEASWWAAARTLELPKSRVHDWYDGEKPLVVKKIERADAYGWFDATWDSEIGRAFNLIIAAVLSGGWLKQDYRIGISLGDDPDATVAEALQKAIQVLVGAAEIIDADDATRTTTLQPETDQVLLGRAVHAIGVQTGRKTEGELLLPEYVTTAPTARQKEFVDMYVALRGSAYKSGKVVLREERPQSYLNALATLLEDATGETIWVGEEAVYLSRAAAQTITTSFSWTADISETPPE